MQPLIVFIIAGLIGGVAVGLQGPLASIIGQRLGSLESVFIVHIGGALASGLLLLGARGGNLGQWQTLPWYTLIAGVFGLIVVSAANFTIPKLGATGTIALIVAGQLVIGLMIDHFGLFDIDSRTIDLQRLLGVGVLMVGVYLILR
ncbi:MAG: hypothetical protein CL610_00355 [Anaerolineaceae bacterium]|nr:hypothetical protein [Anaerolineaceae bacterium]